MEVGDPLTPDFPASDGMYRLQDVDWPAKIPVQHVEFHLAMKLLDQLEGKSLELVTRSKLLHKSLQSFFIPKIKKVLTVLKSSLSYFLRIFFRKDNN